jgi:hypothetical protein
MNLCMASLTTSGLPNSTAVTLTFESLADGATLIASGTTNGSGVLTIAAANLPDFIAGVTYKLTPSQTWTMGECATVTFQYFGGPTGFITGEANTIEECS